MLKNLIQTKQIENAKHILIKSNKSTLAQASVLYSYFLTLHKKVSWYTESFDVRFSFLPWVEKVRYKQLDSADVEIESDIALMDLFGFLEESSVKINTKMATALYAGFLQYYKNFTADNVDGMVFAAMSKLMFYGANHKQCVQHLCKSMPLRVVRFQAILFEKFVLKENAKIAYVSIDSNDLLHSGVSMQEAIEAAKELLNIVHVEMVQLVKSDENNKIITIKDI